MSVPPDKAKSVFLNAVEIAAAAEREAYLAGECGGNAALRREVEALLERHGQIGSFLEAAAPGLAVATADEPIREGPGTVIGPYKLLEQIGEGGFGVVFMAEQQQPLRRKVAVKVVKPGMDTRQVVARFEAERQALALMDHPNIARVLDAGETASGRPYFVMELVKGVPVTEFCDQDQLTPRERLGLFGAVCEAVQHAHQKGVIHRDLKLSNVLVTLHDGKPVVKVIDFGIAKALREPLTDTTLFTGFGQLLGTPLYMSPEQAELSGLDVDTRSDIYALGVLLYELLTGTTPFDQERLRRAGYDELRRIIREEEPPKPSTRVTTLGQAMTTAATRRRSDPKRLSRLFRGELDWIVMKALEKDRNRRYQTAGAFADDVRRYLHDEPVQAHPPSAAYRFWKVARRHRGKALAGAAMLALLLAGVAASTWQAVRATRAERAAREALDALTDDVVETLFLQQAELTDDEKAFLRKVVGLYEAFARQLGGTAEARELRAKGHYKVAHVRELLGEQHEAEAGYRQACDWYERLAADFPDVPRYRERLAVCHNNLGLRLRALGRHAEAEAACRRAVALLEPLVAEFSDVPLYRQMLAVSFRSLSLVLGDEGKRAEAEAACRQALEQQQTLVDRHGDIPKYRHELAVSHNNLGFSLMGLGKRDEAAECYRRALDLHEQLVTQFPAAPEYRRELARTHNNVANLLREQGKYAAAETACRQGLDLRQRLADDFPARPGYRHEIADSYNTLARVFGAWRKWADAEAACRQAVDVHEKLVARFPAVPEYRHDLAICHNNLGWVLVGRGERPKAAESYGRALELQQALAAECPAVPKFRRELARTQHNLGDLLQKQNKYAEAETAYRAALEHRQRLVDEIPEAPAYRRELATTQHAIGAALYLQHRPAEALPWFERTLGWLQPLHQQEPYDLSVRRLVGNGHRDRARALGELQRPAEALTDWDRALELSAPATRPWRQVERARCRAQVGNVTQAVEEATAVAEDPKASGGLLYNVACVYALAAAQEDRQREAYAGEALALLRRAQAAGFFKNLAEVTHMKEDTDLALLRPREDFQKFVGELEAPAQP